MKFFVVDAFTSSVFRGNPAAVCVLDNFLSDELMQNIAFELNLADTAFVVPAGDVYQIRWFTPQVEIGLCGHGTLAASHILWSEFDVQLPEIVYTCKSGTLRTWKDAGSITMDFPANSVNGIAIPPELSESVALSPVAVAESMGNWIVELSSEHEVRSFAPDAARITALPCKALIITTKAIESSEYDFISRFFGPKDGVLEDPVTGSAHCKLAPYWAAKLGKTDLRAFQASSRGGSLRLSLHGDRVWISGEAITVYSGVFRDV